jgi:hypothetical protein
MSWKGVGLFFGFVFALSAWSWSGALLTTKPISITELAEYFLSIFQRGLITYFPIYLMVSLADGLPLTGSRRIGALASALVIGVMLAVQVRCALLPNQMLYVYGSTQLPFCTAFPTWRTYVDFPNTWISPLTTAAVVMVFLFGRRRDRELNAALHAASSAQIESRRQRIESEIAAMHSRVDPDELLASLHAIRAKYEEGVAAGEERLDELIQGLREAAGRPSTAGAGE